MNLPVIRVRWRIVLLLALLSPGPGAAGDPPPGAAAEAEKLEQIRGRIREVESNIEAARDETESLLADLRETEVAAAAAAARLAEIEAQQAAARRRLDDLRREQEQQRGILGQERRHLAAQVRAAYRMGRQDFVKLLLNQEDPALIGRMLAYHDYFNRARARRIGVVASAITRLDGLGREIEADLTRVEELGRLQQAKLAELDAHRDARGAVVARLEQFIQSQDRELQVLLDSEQELADLLERLSEEKSVVRAYEELPPFGSLQGKLTWPVEGTISSAFGSPRKGGRLRSQGVTIRADGGSEVRAVSSGKIIFADWFRNLGLMVILDHGDGYMSLYGHNARLLKKAGDMVQRGEAIALVGDTGGQRESALYFEIRSGGSPVDPGRWCRG